MILMRKLRHTVMIENLRILLCCIKGPPRQHLTYALSINGTQTSSILVALILLVGSKWGPDVTVPEVWERDQSYRRVFFAGMNHKEV